MNKTERLQEIMKIIREEKMGSQEELLEKLNQRGFYTTQATLSRDLKYLRVGKRSDPVKGSVYFLPQYLTLQDEDSAPYHAGNKPYPDAEGFLSIDYTSIFAVIKTLPGHAAALAYKIDNLNNFEILGTIAGDDTILVITREGIPRATLVQCLRPLLPV